MKSVEVLVLTLLASKVVAQPHTHHIQHHYHHMHPARHEHQYGHENAKRATVMETIVEWVTETVLEVIDSTSTEWITYSAKDDGVSATTLSVVATPCLVPGPFPHDGHIFDDVSSVLPTSTLSLASASPAAAPTTSLAVSVALSPNVDPTISSSSTTSVIVAPEQKTVPIGAYVAPIGHAAPAITSTTPIASTAASTPEGAAKSSSDDSTFTGRKITWIGPSDGAYSSCGAVYGPDTMYVAVNPSILNCGADGQGLPMTITANGHTAQAVAIDKCMGCDVDHIDVSTPVYIALGYSTDDGGMHDTGIIKWVIS